MPNRPSDEWERLGEMLVRRRVELDPRYRNRRTFAGDRDSRLYRLFSDIELGKRASYKPATLAAVEKAYELEPGAIGQFLSGGGLEPLEAGRSGPAGASPAEAPQVIRVLATIGRNTAAEIAEMTVLTDKVKAVVAAARAYQQFGQLDGRKLFPRDSTQDQRLAKAWNVLNAMGFDDELHASIAVWNVVGMAPRLARGREPDLTEAAARLGRNPAARGARPGPGRAGAGRTARPAGGRRAGPPGRRGGRGRWRSGRAAVRSGRRR